MGTLKLSFIGAILTFSLLSLSSFASAEDSGDGGTNGGNNVGTNGGNNGGANGGNNGGTSDARASQWDNFGFGAGISFTWDLGNDDRIKSARVVDGIVRVEDKENGVARLVLEAHYFFDYTTWGWGPFVALQPGEEELIDAVGAGIMWGFRKNTSDDASFNLGIGFMADPNTRVLGDGIEENKPLPGGETDVRYAEETQGGLVMIFSTSW